jgi:hypothetical protein
MGRLEGKWEGTAVGRAKRARSNLGRCQECHRVGVPLTRTAALCEGCSAIIAEEIHGRVLAIQKALRQVREKTSVQARRRHWDLILAWTEALLEYEAREIPPTWPPPSILLQDFRALRSSDEPPGSRRGPYRTDCSSERTTA